MDERHVRVHWTSPIHAFSTGRPSFDDLDASVREAWAMIAFQTSP